VRGNEGYLCPIVVLAEDILVFLREAHPKGDDKSVKALEFGAIDVHMSQRKIASRKQAEALPAAKRLTS
jgi:hypothetical protein